MLYDGQVCRIRKAKDDEIEFPCCYDISIIKKENEKNDQRVGCKKSRLKRPVTLSLFVYIVHIYSGIH